MSDSMFSFSRLKALIFQYTKLPARRDYRTALVIEPLPLQTRTKTRGRALSIQSFDVQVQQDCSFLNLPLELREPILRLATGGDGRILKLSYADDGKYQLKARILRGEHSFKNEKNCPNTRQHRQTIFQNMNILGLVLVCRQMYQECIQLLYSNSWFCFDNPIAIEFLPHLLLPQRLNQIQYLCLNWPLEGPPPSPCPDCYAAKKWTANPCTARNYRYQNWTEVWKILASMEGLKKLRLEIEFPTVDNYYWSEKDFEGVRNVRYPEQVQIVLGYLLKRKVERWECFASRNIELLSGWSFHTAPWDRILARTEGDGCGRSQKKDA